MSKGTKPPDSPFCMNCGPRAILDAHPERHRLRCPCCGTEAIDKLSFNVALARLMELASAASTARAKAVLVRLLAPLAPHLAEELWAHLGQAPSVHTEPWPTPDRGLLESQPIIVGVQVDGRTRTRIEVEPDAKEEEVVAAALAAIGNVQPSRVVYVPRRLVNLVLAEGDDA